MKYWIAVGLVLVGAGCGETKTVTVIETKDQAAQDARSNEETDEGAFGTVQTDDQGLALAVLKFERGLEGPSYGHLTLSEGARSTSTHEFARIDLKAENEGSGTVSLWGFSLVDEGGRRYGEEPNELFEPNALGESLGPRDVLRGYTGFVIPKRATIMSVHYAPPTGGPTLSWTLPRAAK